MYSLEGKPLTREEIRVIVAINSSADDAPAPLRCTPTTPVPEAVRMMLAHQIKRLVVVNEMGKPLGLVDRQQLLRSLVEGGAQPE